MPSALTQRALTRIQDSGYSRAKKLATIAIRTNVDSKGNTTVAGYQAAIQLLSPYLQSGSEKEALDAQSIIAQYTNSATKIGSSKRDQNETVSSFKLQEQDAYFTKFDGDIGSFRNPTDLMDTTSTALDMLLVSLIDTINQKQADGESTDTLLSYYKDLNKRANEMRELNNRFQRGELPAGQALDGFGYYVDTDPMTGQVRGAALIPVNSAPDGLTEGYRRVDTSAKVGESLLPVYAPAQKRSDGTFVARVGSSVWSGNGEGALTGEANAPRDGDFSIQDAATFPLATTSVQKGSFARGYIGKDEEGNPVEAYYYRGQDNKLYTVDQATIESFKKDPILSSKLNGYVQQLSPTDMRDLKAEAKPFSQDRIGAESKIISLQSEAAAAQAEADRMNPEGFFAKAKFYAGEVANDLKSKGRSLLDSQPEPVAPTSEAVPQRASFFSRTNVPNKPDSAPTGSNAESIIEKGKDFFRKGRNLITQQ